MKIPGGDLALIASIRPGVDRPRRPTRPEPGPDLHDHPRPPDRLRHAEGPPGRPAPRGGSPTSLTPSPNVLAMAMSGSVAANAFLGHTSTATETFHLEQEFEVELLRPRRSTRPADPGQLPGRVRPVEVQGRAPACGWPRRRSAWPAAPETPAGGRPPAALPSRGTTAGSATSTSRLIKVDRMPLGRYLLVADFVLSCEAGGLTDGHSAADFSPSTALPSDWVRTRDPFQGSTRRTSASSSP